MIKLRNSVFKLVVNAKRKINYVETEDAIKIQFNKMNMFIYIRNIRKIKKSGRILGSKHVLRGILQFWVGPNSLYHKKFFNQNSNIIFCYASDWRSALVTLTANIRLLNTSHLIGGYDRWHELNNPIKKAR